MSANDSSRGLDPHELDRHITGNYGEDQVDPKDAYEHVGLAEDETDIEFGEPDSDEDSGGAA